MQKVFSFLSLVGFFVSAFLHSRAAQLDKNPFDFSHEETYQRAFKERPTVFRLLLSNNLEGYVGPCGCAVRPRGGLDRRWNLFQKLNETGDLIVLDAGNTLFPSTQIGAQEERSALKQANLIAEHNFHQKIKAWNIGELDLARGLPFLTELVKKHGSPFLATNLKLKSATKKAPFQSHYELKLSNSSLFVLGFSRHDYIESRDFELVNFKKSFLEKIKTIPPGLPVIVLSDLSLEENRRLADLSSRSVIILGSKELGSLERPEQRGKSLIWQVLRQGQQSAYLNVAWNPKAQFWFNPELNEHWKKTWSYKAQSYQVLSQEKKSSEVKQELKEHKEALERIAQFAASKEEKENHYFEFKAFDMDKSWAQKNRWTEFSK